MAPLVTSLLAAALGLAAAFNVDTRHPVVFRGPPDAVDAHFGFAVALTSGAAQPWVLVGAPRANSSLGVHPEIREPGALFRCPALSSGRCEEVLVDTDGNDLAPDLSYTNLRDGGWLGGSLDAETGAGGRTVVCAPRWRNQRYGGHFLGNGACYVGGPAAADAGFEKLVPLAARDKQYTNQLGINAYLYSYGEAGVSAHLASDGQLLLGAPGVFDWTGSVAAYSAPTDGAQSLHVPNPAAFPDLMGRYDYFGYAVGSGRFSGDSGTQFLVGAPRAAAGRGKVYLLTLGADDSQPYGVIAERVGDDVGDYFGGAVLAVDVDGDGLDDALVGAPLAAGGSFDEGRVYVLMNSGAGRLRETARLEGRAVGGRLGTTLASLGDLDGDGYQDVAVAAPYEEEGRGAVYIFRGGPGDFATAPAQRIAASALGESLRGFGISVSRGVDLDGNAHPDFAVGAYGSGEVVLLRASPVIQFVSSLTSSPERLHMSVREFQVRACLAYSGAELETVRVHVMLKMESFHAQGVFRVGGGQGEREANFTVYIFRDEPTCETLEVDILSNSSLIDYTKAMQISMRYAVASSDSDEVQPVFVDTDTEKRAADYEVSARRRRQIQFPDGPRPADSFCTSCPVANVNLPNQRATSLTVPFSVGCGEDATCQTDLRLRHSFPGLAGDTYVIGSTRTLELELALTNGAEPASLPRLTVEVPSAVSLRRLPPACREGATTPEGVTLICNVLPHPFYNTSEHVLPLVFDMHDVTGDLRTLTFNVSATSAGVELTPANNVANITLTLVSEADVEIRGKARDATLLFGDEEAAGGAARYEYIQHTYQVSKYLPTPVRAVNVSFLVPVAVVAADGAAVVVAQVYPPAAFVNGQPLTCAIKDGAYVLTGREPSGERASGATLDFSDLQAEESRIQPSHPAAGDEVEDAAAAAGAGRRRRRDTTETAPPAPASDSASDSALLIECTPGAPTRCARITCQTVSLLATSDRVTVALELRVDVAALSALGARRALLTTIGRARIVGDASVPAAVNVRPDRAQATTELLGAALAPEEVPIWIVVVAVLGALLLLALITQGLAMAGFFRRSSKEALAEKQQQQAQWHAPQQEQQQSPPPVQEEEEDPMKEDFGDNMFIVPGPPAGKGS